MTSAARMRLRRLRRATAGTAAVEFALLAPLLILFYFGMAETCQLMIAQRRVSHSAAAMADLVTQGGELDTEERDDIFLAGRMILAPFPVEHYRVRLTSVVRTNDKNVVDWSEVSGTGLAKLPKGSVATIKTPLTENGQSVVMAEVEFDHESTVGYALPGVMKLKHAAELRPRRTNTVIRCTHNAATGACVPI
jgi:Flp pilus assembly protein TadG